MRELIHNVGADYVAFAVTGFLVLIVSLIYVWWIEKSSGKLSFPGLKSKDKILGNLGELTQDGGFHQFLVNNHKNLGPMFSFYWGKNLAVSVASPSHFKDVVTLFDRPVAVYDVFKPLLGEHSIQYINSPEGRKHRKVHDSHYSFSAINDYFHLFVDISKELETKWKTINKDEHIPLSQHMLAIAIKSILKTTFGPDYFKSNKEILEFQKAYHTCWEDIEARTNGDMPEAESERQKNFDTSIAFIKNKVKEIIHHRQALKERSHCFLDVLLEEEEMYCDDEMIMDTVVTYLVAGGHTTAYLLTWALYYICLNPDVEEKVRAEIVAVLADEDITMKNCDELMYTKRVINETLRCSVLTTISSRISSFDIVVGGHIIRKNTPIIMALGAVMQDSTIWPEPTKFNPDRFNPEEVKSREPLAFQPFGFAGKRKCPGYRYAYYEALVYLTTVIRKFKIKLIEGQEISKHHSLVTVPTEEIWISVEC